MLLQFKMILIGSNKYLSFYTQIKRPVRRKKGYKPKSDAYESTMVFIAKEQWHLMT